MHPIRCLLSLTALSALALAAVIPHNCHDTDKVSATGESREQAAGLARSLVKNTNVGTFMTVMNDARQEGRLEGNNEAVPLNQSSYLCTAVGQRTRVDFFLLL